MLLNHRGGFPIRPARRTQAGAAAIMSLIQSARLNGHDLYAYLKNVLTPLPAQKNNQIAERRPHRWQPAA